MEPLERYRGSLLGLATGDALGAPFEGKRSGSFEPVDDITGGGFHNIEPGQWTDDTSMALCLAKSLVERRGFDPTDQLERYVRWFREGHLSSRGKAFGIGNTTMEALLCFEETGEPYCGPTAPNKAGNGSIMRLAPVPLFFAQRPQEAIERSAESSRTTHGAKEAVDGCRYFGSACRCGLGSRQGGAALGALLPGRRWILGRESVGVQGRSGRVRLVQAQGAAGDTGVGLHSPLARGGSLGFS